MAELVEKFGDAPRHDAVITVDKYGNTASTTQTVALVDEFEAKRIEPGETVALVAPASGLEIGVVLFTPDKELLDSYGNNH
jgi:3-oxoacyl-[acyl-carrier-protein] synthase III